MKTRIAIAACVAVLGAASAAHAAQLLSPAIFGAHTQDVARCVVVNGDTATIAVNIRIVDENGFTLASRNDSLVPGQFGSVDTFIPFGVAHACVVTAPSVGNLRAALTIVERIGVDERPIRSAPLR